MDRREDESNWAHACRVLGLDSHHVAPENSRCRPGPPSYAPMLMDRPSPGITNLAGGNSATRRSRD